LQDDGEAPAARQAKNTLEPAHTRWGKKGTDSSPRPKKLSKEFEEQATGPDMKALLNKIEGLEKQRQQDAKLHQAQQAAWAKQLEVTMMLLTNCKFNDMMFQDLKASQYVQPQPQAQVQPPPPQPYPGPAQQHQPQQYPGLAQQYQPQQFTPHQFAAQHQHSTPQQFHAPVPHWNWSPYSPVDAMVLREELTHQNSRKLQEQEQEFKKKMESDRQHQIRVQALRELRTQMTPPPGQAHPGTPGHPSGNC